MKFTKRRLFLIGLTAWVLFVIFGGTAKGQTVSTFVDRPGCPANFVCISQESANKAAQLARENPALIDEVKVLKAQLTEKDQIIADNKKAARDNEADLVRRLHETEVKLATATGQIIECRSDKTMYTGLIEYLTKNQKSKQNGVINIKLGGQ